MSKKEEYIEKCQELLKNNKDLFNNSLIVLAYPFQEGDSELQKFIKLKLECRSKNGDADKIPLSYALYGLLWGKDNPCNINAITLIGNENIKYDGDHLNTSRKYKKDTNKYICELEKLGNFMPCPKIKIRYNLTLNQARNIYLQDKFDLYLREVRNYYYSGEENEFNGEKTENKNDNKKIFREILEDNAEYFKLFGKGENGFRSFIENNYLQDYINEYENKLKIKDEDISQLNDIKIIKEKIDTRGNRMYNLLKNQI